MLPTMPASTIVRTATKNLRFVSAWIFLLAFSINAQVQNNGAARPDRGITPSSSYSMSEIERINTSNGNLGISIPLASLPPMAGGKLGLTLSAHYNSKIWDVLRVDSKPIAGKPKVTKSGPVLSTEGGWRVEGTYSFDIEDSEDEYEYAMQNEADPIEQFIYNNNWVKAYIIDPDGAKHEMKLVDYTAYFDDYPFLFGYYQSSTLPEGVAKRYYSYDGSYISAVVYPSGSPIKSVITLRDGTQIISEATGVKRIVDTNGNSIKIYNTTDLSTGIVTTHFLDEGAEREIKIWRFGQTSHINYPKVGGNLATVQILWGTTLVGEKLYDTQDLDPGNQNDSICLRTHVFNSDIPVITIRQIILPPTEPGLPGKKFLFEYNSEVLLDPPPNYLYQLSCDTTSPYYTFSQSTKGWGMLSKMTMPSEALVTYAYTSDGVFYIGEADQIANMRLTSKTVTHDGRTDTWSYSIFPNGGSSVAAPDGAVTEETAYIKSGNYGAPYGGLGDLSGLVYRIDRIKDANTKIRIERRWGTRKFTGANDVSPGGRLVINPVILAEYTTLYENGAAVKTSAKTYEYDYNGNLTSETCYDWFATSLITSRDAEGIPNGVPVAAAVIRATSTSYYNGAAQPGDSTVYAKRPITSLSPSPTPLPIILNAPNETITGTSKTKYNYDYGTTPTKGNVTTLSQWHAPTSEWFDSTYIYDSKGNRTRVTDPEGKITDYEYNSAARGDLIKITSDPGNGTAVQITEFTYDQATSKLLTQKDPNGNITTTSYVNHLLEDIEPLGNIDPFGRPGTITGPAVDSTVGGTTHSAQNHVTKNYYYDTARQVVAESDLNTSGDAKLKTRTTTDQLGRVILSETNEGGAAYTISSHTIYVDMGRITHVSNPKRSTASTTDGWVRTTLDTLGRVTEVAHFSGSNTPPNTGTSTIGTNLTFTGKVATTYYAEETTVTDQDDKSRNSVTDGLGRLAKIIEDPAGLAYPTNYTYDYLSNLTEIVQGTGMETQTRTFAYDSISRLITATNPESGMVSYTYFKNGSLKQKTDARGVQTNYTYDGLNRIKEKTYSSSNTPTVKYYYDGQTLPSGAPAITSGAIKGRLNAVTYGGGVNGTYYGYDSLGRIRNSMQVTDGLSYALSYKFNLAGNMTEETYPSGRTIQYGFDSAGRLGEVKGTDSGLAKVYLQIESQYYTPTGLMTQQQLGNGLWEHYNYNGRLQLTRLSVGRSLNSAIPEADSHLRLDYGYGGDTTKNNGNLHSQLIKINWATTSPILITQIYDYDALSRISSFNESGTGVAAWSQTYSYDRFGNRAVVGGTVSKPTLTPTSLDDYDKTKNRLTKAGYGYDTAGNQTTAPNPAGSQQTDAFTFDAENRIKTVLTGQSDTYIYTYDGEGNRVKKFGPSSAVYIYNAQGLMAAEYTTPGPGAIASGTRYITSDHLGSTRLITSGGSGVAKARYDYLPFGEELGAGYGARTSSMAFTPIIPDPWRQKFGSKERDNETGLDYFLARYYSSAQGRFTSPDEFTGGPVEIFSFAEDASVNPLFYADFTNPQSINKYQYAYNNPLRYTDPTGHCPTCIVQQVASSPAGQEVMRRLTPYIAAGTAAAAAYASGALDKLGDVANYILDHTPQDPGYYYVTYVNGVNQPRGVQTQTTPSQGQPLDPPAPMEVRGRGKNNTKPVTGTPGKLDDPPASGPHSTWKTDPKTGKITGTETWVPNPKNPKGFDSRKRGDFQPKGKTHNNIPTPHIQGGKRRGARPAGQNETPKNAAEKGQSDKIKP